MAGFGGILLMNITTLGDSIWQDVCLAGKASWRMMVESYILRGLK